MQKTGYSVLVCAILSTFAATGDALSCYVCRDVNDPYCSSYVETVCGVGQDSCWKYSGNFMNSGKLYEGRTLRSCASSAYLTTLSPEIRRGRCGDVRSVPDAISKNTYSGRFCLCSDSYCNSSPLLSSSVALLTISLMAATVKYFS